MLTEKQIYSNIVLLLLLQGESLRNFRRMRIGENDFGEGELLLILEVLSLEFSFVQQLIKQNVSNILISPMGLTKFFFFFRKGLTKFLIQQLLGYQQLAQVVRAKDRRY